jgi:predicted phage tail protein
MESTDLKEVILEGFLGEKYGRKWSIAATEYRDIFACIEANYPESKKDIIDLYLAGGDVSIQTGESIMEEAEEYFFPIKKGTIIITPLPTGSKSGSAKILGAVALAALFFIPGVNVLAGALASASFGAGATAAGAVLAAGGTTAAASVVGAAVASIPGLLVAGLALNLAIVGLQQLLAPDPSVDDPDSNNYLFNGPENTAVSGNPVPVLCGEMMIGGIVISSGSIGGFWANESTYVEDVMPDSGVEGGNRYNPPPVYIPPGGGNRYNPAVRGISVFTPPTATTTSIAKAVDDQSLGIKTLGTDEFTMSAP